MKRADPAFLRRVFVRASLLPVVLLGVLVGLLAWQANELLAVSRSVNHADQVITKATETQKLLVDLETGLRGYILTGERDFLEPFTRARPLLPLSLRRLEALASDRPDQAARVRRLEPQATAWLAYGNQVLEARDHGGDFRSIILTRRGKALMDRMRASLDAVIRAETHLRAQRSNAAQRTTLGAIGLGSLFTILTGLSLAIMTTRQLGGVAKTYEALLDERAAAETELQRRAEELMAADRHKDEFLAMLGHELRSPLGSMTNALYLLRLRGGDDPGVVRSCDVLDRQLKHVVRITADLQDLSRIKSGKLLIRKSRIDLYAALNQALEITRPVMAERRHTVAVHGPPGPIWIDGDPERLTQVVVNILDNAAKYSPEGGHVEVTVREAAEEALISVRDRGDGIAPEMLERVFDLFLQADSNDKKSGGGLGIGLALVRGLVAMHGGTVSAVSEGPGKGSEFTVRLPLRDADDEDGATLHFNSGRPPRPA